MKKITALTLLELTRASQVTYRVKILCVCEDVDSVVNEIIQNTSIGGISKTNKTTTLDFYTKEVSLVSKTSLLEFSDYIRGHGFNKVLIEGNTIDEQIFNEVLIPISSTRPTARQENEILRLLNKPALSHWFPNDTIIFSDCQVQDVVLTN